MFEIKASRFFLKQIEKLDEKSRRVIHDKIRFIKQNPFRYKKIHSRQFPEVFRIRFSINSKETRLIYAVFKDMILLACLLDRKHNYSELEKYLVKLKKDEGI
jgi:mRNA-degrading endonuclease RelE of RelBE toxin-antitoxin system